MEGFAQKIKKGSFKDTLLEPGHDRGIICGSLNSSVIITGSMDHGLRAYNSKNGKFIRELFSKKYGHTEWVTSVQISSKTNRIISGGMDGVICYWHNSEVKCENFIGHKGSISKLLIDKNDVIISSSYDCSLKIWPLTNLNSTLSFSGESLEGFHQDPILDFSWSNSLLISGDKAGKVVFWDINVAKAISNKNFHTGPCQITHLTSINENSLVVTAGQKDGKLIIYDLRESRPIYSKKVHLGSINTILSYKEMLITGSADKKVKLFDIKNLENNQTFEVSESVEVGKNVDSAALFGLSNGFLVCLDLNQKKICYNFGCSKSGAVRVIETCLENNSILIGSDDPCPIFISF